MPKGLLIFLSALLMMVSHNVLGHQQKAAETTVLFNERSGHVEVMHRFYLHDTEHAVQDLFNDKHADILDSEETQQLFANYVAKQFGASTLKGELLSLDSVGFEVEGKFFWVYQDTALPKGVQGLKLRNGALRDLWPMQINMVNVERQGDVKTLYFKDNEDWLEVRF